MELKDFIKTVLTDIVGAVEDCQKDFGDKATVMPYRTHTATEGGEINTSKGHAIVSDVDFDVALTSSNEKSDGNALDGGLRVAGLFSVKGKTGSDDTEMSQCVSRVRFTLPVVLPHATVPNISKENKGGCAAAIPMACG